MAKARSKPADKEQSAQLEPAEDRPAGAAIKTAAGSKSISSRRRLSDAQKAAAVVIALGAEKASKLYQYMEPDEVEQLTVEVAQMGYVDYEDTLGVLTEYQQMCMTNKAFTEGGLEYARTVLEKAYGAQTANALLEKVARSLKHREFTFMRKATKKDLFSAIQYERPQTMALLLSYVEPDVAAAVLEQLNDAKRVRVVESIAKMESASPTVIQIIEAEMSKKFSSIVTSENIKVGGIDFVASVMNNLDRNSEKSVFDGLSVRDRELTDEIRKRMFVFEDIVSMDDRSVQRFLRDCDLKDLVLSLKTANADVANKLFANMSARLAQTIQDDLEVTSNVRLRDVESAQQRIVDIIRALEEKNEIIILKGGKDDIIA